MIVSPFIGLCTIDSRRNALLNYQKRVNCVNNRKIYFICFSDLAYKKKTEQSSTAYNGFSSRAVDENYSTYYDDKSCTHTNKEMNPWWRVDLGREYIVTGDPSVT